MNYLKKSILPLTFRVMQKVCIEEKPLCDTATHPDLPSLYLLCYSQEIVEER